MARRTLALLAVAATAVGTAATGPTQADITVAAPQANSTQLFVKNKADVDVLLANCAENHTLPAGGNVTVTLSGETGYWVVPVGLSWDCESTPAIYDLFYVAANFTGSELVASIGHGMPEGVTDEAGPPGENRSEPLGENRSSSVAPGSDDDDDDGDEHTEGQEAQRLVGSLAGVELSSGARAVRCSAASCGSSPEATTAGAIATEGLSLTIMPRRASPLSFWYRGGYRGYRGYGWGRPRWGPRWGGRGRWGCR